MPEPENETLTTGEVAKYCGVNFRTVIRWIEKGYLKSYKLPGRGDNRIPVADFIRFLEEQGMPVPTELKPEPTQSKVLVVDDDEGMASAIRRTLRRAGYEVECAANGLEAGMKLERFRPAVMTLDLQMPHMGGYEVLKAIRHNPELRDMRVLVISGLSENELEDALVQGADRILQKPFSNEALVRHVSELLLS